MKNKRRNSTVTTFSLQTSPSPFYSYATSMLSYVSPRKTNYFYEGNDIYGILRNSNNEIIYVGEWKNRRFEGRGNLKNEKYIQNSLIIDFNKIFEIQKYWKEFEGDFKNNVFFGHGILTLSNGEKFIGEFMNGKILGKGMFITKDKNIVIGVWKNGILEETLN